MVNAPVRESEERLIYTTSRNISLASKRTLKIEYFRKVKNVTKCNKDKNKVVDKRDWLDKIGDVGEETAGNRIDGVSDSLWSLSEEVWSNHKTGCEIKPKLKEIEIAKKMSLENFWKIKL